MRDLLTPLLDVAGQEETGTIRLLPLLAWAHLDLGNEQEAETLVDQALTRIAMYSFRRLEPDALRIKALVRARQGRWDEAMAASHAAITRCRAMPYPYAEAKALYVFGQIHAAKGERRRARERYEAALAICARLGERLYAEHIERAIAQADRATSTPPSAPLAAHTRAKRRQA